MASHEVYRFATSSRQIMSSELALVRRTCESNNWALSDDFIYRDDYCLDFVGWNTFNINVRKGFDAQSIKTEADWDSWKR